MYGFNLELTKRNVVIYGRVSTEHEAQLSALENQLDWYKPILAARPEWTLIGTYVDEGITGTSAEKRPQFQKMIRDAKKQKFDLIITREVSRFARNTVDTLQYTRELKACGVEVFFINDNIKTFDSDGELRLTIMATLAQDESRKTSIRVKSGQQTSMENGVFYGNGNILGYDRVGKKMVINPEQAKTVRMIYDMYLDGKGLTQIKYKLEAMGRLTSTGKSVWYCTVISHILRNSFYCGIITYHKEFTPDYLTQKKVKNYGEIEQIQVKGTHEPIVSVEEFEKVQKIMESKRCSIPNLNTGKRSGQKPYTTIWGKLMVCSCGNHFNRRTWNRKDGSSNVGYICHTINNKGSLQTRKNKGLSVIDTCDTPQVQEWKLKMIAKYIFEKYIVDTSTILSLAQTLLEKHIADKGSVIDNSSVILHKENEVDKLKRKLNGYMEMRSEGEISKEIFLAKRDELNKKISLLETEINELYAEEDMSCQEEEHYKEKLDSLKKLLNSYVDFENLTDIPEKVIEAFVKEIRVSKDGLEWHLRTDGSVHNCSVKGRKRKTGEVVESEPDPPLCHLIERNTGSYCRWQEVIFTQFAEFTLTIEDAQEYVYSISSTKRVRGWRDIEVKLYI